MATSASVTAATTPTAEAVPSNAPRLVAAPGRVEPVSEEIATAAELPGRLRDPLVEEGDRVEESAGRHRLLDVAAVAREVIGRVALIDADHVLLDDGPFIELGRDVATRRADERHSAVVRLVIRPRAGERRQEARSGHEIVSVQRRPETSKGIS